MSSYRIITTKRFLRRLKNLDSSVKERVLDAVQDISERPRTGSTMIYNEHSLYKYRVGDYRIIYKVDETERAVIFIIVEHRRRVYRNLT